MKKKLLALLLAAVMVLSLAACGGKTDTPPADSGNPSTSQPDGGDSTAQPDGGQFGLGAEIGISTQKLHARGPFALDALTSYKYVLRGSGQVRS